MVMGEVAEIKEWLRSIGFDTPWAQVQARSVLEAAGLTRPGKLGMASDKVPRALAALELGIIRVCGDAICRTLGTNESDGRLIAEVRADRCEICAGSDNRRAARAMIAAFHRAGRRRLLILGGTAVNHAELTALLAGSEIELRCIDGAERTPTKKDAIRDLAWADTMAVWASTPLPHKVSVPYTDEAPSELRWITVARRGVAALCTELRLSVEGGNRRRSSTR